MPRALGDIISEQLALHPRRDEPEVEARLRVLAREYRESHDYAFGIDHSPEAVRKRLRLGADDPRGDREIA